MSMIAATSPAVAAAPTTWPAGSRRAVSASVAAATTKASTPLPASAQLSAMPGASVLNPAAWVAFRVRFQATNPAVVASPPSSHRPRWCDQGRVQGSPARTKAAAASARTAKMTMSRTANTAAPISIGVNITIGWLDLGWLGWVWVGLAPGVQRVADERAFVEQSLVVGLHRKAALADRQQPRAQRVAVQIVGDVGGVHDPGQPAQGRVAAELEGVDQDLEGALVPTVGELRTGGVERAGLFDFGDGEDLVGGDVADLGLGGGVGVWPGQAGRGTWRRRRSGSAGGSRPREAPPRRSAPPARAWRSRRPTPRGLARS